MRHKLVTLAIAFQMAIAAAAAQSWAASGQGWPETIAIDRASLSDRGRNPYFVLEPGYELAFKSSDGKLLIRVLDDTKMVDNVKTRVVEEREWAGRRLVEVSRNYFAISTRDNTVYYFGEDVDMYNASGKLTGHGGSWLAGTSGARAGIIMPGKPVVGLKHYQELAPKVAMDRAEVVSVDDKLNVPAGKFGHVLKVRETSPLEPGASATKYYAPGVGLLNDDELKLVSYGKKAQH